MIYVETKRKSLATIQKLHPDATIIDVTSKGEEPWVKVSPFYPHGGIPVPGSDNVFSASVEGVWQGLKVFENEDVDVSKFENTSMKGLKRTVRKYGKPLGHRLGIHGTDLLDYATARRKIYLHSYGWMLENKAASVIDKIIHLAESGDVVLLDYDTNGDLNNLKSPLSHAALVKRFIEKKHPHLALITKFTTGLPVQSDKTTKKPEQKKFSDKTKISKNSSGQLSLLEGQSELTDSSTPGLTKNCQYQVVRYVHDDVSGEFMNVGLVFYNPETGLVRAEVISNMNRLRAFFPDAQEQYLLSGLQYFAHKLNERGIRINRGALKAPKGLRSITSQLINEARLQLTPVKQVLSDDPNVTFHVLYEQLVRQ